VNFILSEMTILFLRARVYTGDMSFYSDVWRAKLDHWPLQAGPLHGYKKEAV
jgi:hypothetical protein